MFFFRENYEEKKVQGINVSTSMLEHKKYIAKEEARKECFNLELIIAIPLHYVKCFFLFFLYVRLVALIFSYRKDARQQCDEKIK